MNAHAVSPRASLTARSTQVVGTQAGGSRKCQDAPRSRRTTTGQKQQQQQQKPMLKLSRFEFYCHGDVCVGVQKCPPRFKMSVLMPSDTYIHTTASPLLFRASSSLRSAPKTRPCGGFVQILTLTRSRAAAASHVVQHLTYYFGTFFVYICLTSEHAVMSTVRPGRRRPWSEGSQRGGSSRCWWCCCCCCWRLEVHFAPSGLTSRRLLFLPPSLGLSSRVATAPLCGSV